MTDRLRERLGDPKVAHDTRLLGDFARIYCDGKHDGRSSAPLATPGAELGVYGDKPLELCEECAALLEYAEKRRALCPQDKPGTPKPFCSHCETHCYQPDMRELMRDVMRYAGPARGAARARDRQRPPHDRRPQARGRSATPRADARR